jgi:hypothetical protein
MTLRNCGRHLGVRLLLPGLHRHAQRRSRGRAPGNAPSHFARFRAIPLASQTPGRGSMLMTGNEIHERTETYLLA